MDIQKAVLTLVLLVLAGAALAHTKLSSTKPADGETVAAPSEIWLIFSAPVRLTAVKIESKDGARIRVGEFPTDIRETFAVPLDDALAPGDYLVTWRSVSGDSHIVSGEFRFSVAN